MPAPQNVAHQRPPESSDWIIEPLRRGDVDAVTELFDALSPRSRRLRFLGPTPRLSTKMLSHLVDVDGAGHFAVAAWVHGRCVGIARAVTRLYDPTVADVAVAVADAHQGHGLGRRLMLALADEARARGIGEFEATVDPGNRAALGLARSLTANTAYDDGVIRAQRSLALHHVGPTRPSARLGPVP